MELIYSASTQNGRQVKIYKKEGWYGVYCRESPAEKLLLRAIWRTLREAYIQYNQMLAGGR